MIRLNGIQKKYGDHLVLEDFSGEVKPGQILAVLGPSGSGKSTFLGILAGLQEVSAGQISWNLNQAPRIGMVFQDAELLPWLTSQQNAEIPGVIARNPPEKARVLELFQQLGLGPDVMNKYPTELSGGMKMRVSIARALIISPDLLLLDEPFSSLDEVTREMLQDLLLQVVGQRPSMATVFVTHSISEALYLADEVIVLNKKGKPELRFSIEKPLSRWSGYRRSVDFQNLLSKYDFQIRGVFQ